MLTEARKGEIALRYVECLARKKSMTLDPVDFKRQVHNSAKEIGIEPAEAMEFAELIVRKSVEGLFVKK